MPARTELERLSGLHIAKIGGHWKVYRGDDYVGSISSLGPMFNNQLGWDYHRHDMWNFTARELVIPPEQEEVTMPQGRQT